MKNYVVVENHNDGTLSVMLIEKYREMSFENLDNAMYNALKYSIGETLGKGGLIPPCTIAGYNFYTRIMKAEKSTAERKNPKND